MSDILEGNFSFSLMSLSVFPACMLVQHMHAVPPTAAAWVLGTERRFSARATRAFYYYSIPQALRESFNVIIVELKQFTVMQQKDEIRKPASEGPVPCSDGRLLAWLTASGPCGLLIFMLLLKLEQASNVNA